jgi:multidrug resistance protein, MATE family
MEESKKNTVSYKSFLKESLPNILAYISIPLASLFDIAFLGHLPDIHPQAGVALATIIFDYLFWGCSFLRVSTIGLVSQADGEGRDDKKLDALFSSTLLALFLSALILAFQSFITKGAFFMLMGDPLSEAEGLSYFNGRVMGAPFVLSLYCFQGFFIGSRKFKHLLATILVQNIGNIILDYIFIFQIGLGAFGAGLATSLSELVSFLLALYLSRHLLKGFSKKIFSYFKIKEVLKKIFNIHLPFILRTLLFITAVATFTNFSSLLGTSFIACNAILTRIMHFSSYFIDGFATTLEGYSGYLVKQKNFNKLKRIFNLALCSTGIFVLIFNSTLIIFSSLILPLFSQSEEVLFLLNSYLPLMLITESIGSLAYLYDGFFIGISKAKILFRSMLASVILGFIPFAALFLYLKQGYLLWMALIFLMIGRSASLFREKRNFLKEKNAKGGT